MTAHRGCMNTITESAFKVDSGRTDPLSHLHEYCTWHFGPNHWAVPPQCTCLTKPAHFSCVSLTSHWQPLTTHTYTKHAAYYTHTHTEYAAYYTHIHQACCLLHTHTLSMLLTTHTHTKHAAYSTHTKHADLLTRETVNPTMPHLATWRFYAGDSANLLCTLVRWYSASGDDLVTISRCPMSIGASASSSSSLSSLELLELRRDLAASCESSWPCMAVRNCNKRFILEIVSKLVLYAQSHLIYFIFNNVYVLKSVYIQF